MLWSFVFENWVVKSEFLNQQGIKFYSLLSSLHTNNSQFIQVMEHPATSLEHHTLSICDIDVTQKISSIYEMKQDKILQKPKVLIP